MRWATGFSQKKSTWPPDSSVVEWPDDRPIRFKIAYDKTDLHGDNLAPAICLQLIRFNEIKAQPYLQLNEQSDDFTWNWTISGDTLEINTDALISLNPMIGGEYSYLWQFRVRLENPTSRLKASAWVYSSPIRLVMAYKTLGIPKTPRRLKLIF